MYSKYKEGRDLYGLFNELPAILWQYFNILDGELAKHKEDNEARQKETNEMADYINSGKR
jgi:hypothetical protein